MLVWGTNSLSGMKREEIKKYKGVNNVELGEFYNIEDGNIHILHLGDEPVAAHFVCPCGCGREINLPLKGEKRYAMIKSKRNHISFFPSISLEALEEQKSFIIRDNRVIWT